MQSQITFKGPQKELTQSLNEIDHERVCAALSMVSHGKKKRNDCNCQIVMTQTYDINTADFNKIYALITLKGSQTKKKPARNMKTEVHDEIDSLEVNELD